MSLARDMNSNQSITTASAGPNVHMDEELLVTCMQTEPLTQPEDIQLHIDC